MLPPLPDDPDNLQTWTWPEIEPHYAELTARPVTAANVTDWLADWSRLSAHAQELHTRLMVATTVNTADAEAAARYQRYLDEAYPPVSAAEQRLKEKLIAANLEPEGMAVPLRSMRAEAALFRETNLPLMAELQKLNTDYDKLVGSQTVHWDGQEVTLSQLQPAFQELDRGRREAAWRLALQRQLADREAVNELWGKYLRLRLQVATNAGFGNDYRGYRWQQLRRFDYTPEDCARFHQAIKQVVVPAAGRAYERRRQRVGVDQLRPWDLSVDPLGRPPLRPFAQAEELIAGGANIFARVDPAFGEYFAIMRREGLLDLDNRKNKAPGGYCEMLMASRRPFIFMNAVGLRLDVDTLLHEGGHAFHIFEMSGLPYVHQLQVNWEFAEVASMGMELLAASCLDRASGGFYSRADAARARVEHLESNLLFWPYMAVVDAFQHWVYTHPNAAADPAQCDAQWGQLWDRFMPGVDWSGLEDERVTGWHRKLHIHQEPFYYVEYGLAQLGAVQVWANARADQASAVARYRHALALGGTVPLPDLFQAAGARLAFDVGTLQEAVGLIVNTINELESEA